MARGASTAAAAVPTRTLSTRSAKSKANQSLAEEDKDLDRLIAKHDERGARGWAKKAKAEETPVEIDERENEEVSAPRTRAKGKAKKSKVEEVSTAGEEEEEKHEDAPTTRARAKDKSKKPRAGEEETHIEVERREEDEAEEPVVKKKTKGRAKKKKGKEETPVEREEPEAGKEEKASSTKVKGRAQKAKKANELPAKTENQEEKDDYVLTTIDKAKTDGLQEAMPVGIEEQEHEKVGSSANAEGSTSKSDANGNASEHAENEKFGEASTSKSSGRAKSGEIKKKPAKTKKKTKIVTEEIVGDSHNDVGIELQASDTEEIAPLGASKQQNDSKGENACTIEPISQSNTARKSPRLTPEADVEPLQTNPATSSPKRSSLGELQAATHKKQKSDASARSKEEGKGSSRNTKEKGKGIGSSPKKSSSPAKYVPISSHSSSIGKHIRSPTKPRQRGLPEEQIRSFLDNFDLELENRLRTARRLLESSVNSARTQMVTVKIGKLPRVVRDLPMHEFLDLYQGCVQTVQSKSAFVARQEGQGESLPLPLQRKRKDANEEPTASSTRQKVDTTKKVKAVARPHAKGKQKQTFNDPDADMVESPSNVRPPSAAVFAPRLQQSDRTSRAQSPPTGGRVSKAPTDEAVHTTDRGGAPSNGVDLSSGDSRRSTMATKTAMTSAKPSRNWVALEDEVSDTLAQLPDVAKEFDDLGLGSHARNGASSEGPPGAIRAIAHHRSSSHSSNDNAVVDYRDEPESEYTTLTGYEDDDSLPDEAAYTARIMRQEEARRSRMASSSDDNRGASSSKFSFPSSFFHHSSSSPRKGSNASTGRLPSSTIASTSTTAPASSRHRSGSQLSQLRVEDLLAMPASEQEAMMRVFEAFKARQAQLLL